MKEYMIELDKEKVLKANVPAADHEIISSLSPSIEHTCANTVVRPSDETEDTNQTQETHSG